MRLIQMAKTGQYASYWLKAENRQDMLELRKLQDDMNDSRHNTLIVPMITIGAEVADIDGRSLPICIELEIKPQI